MLIIGSAQSLQILLSIVRMKALALLLGPGGIGLLSIFQNLLSTVSTATGLGLASSGVREIASNRDDPIALSRTRRVLLAAHLVQGLFALIGVWLFREQISVWLFENAAYATEVGLVGLAVWIALLSTAQTALLQGLRRVADLGRVTVLGALGGTFAGLAAVWFFGQDGLIWFVLAQPLTGLLVAIYFTRRLSRPKLQSLGFSGTLATWKPMVRLGLAFMLGGLATALTLLMVRAHITQELGLDAAGQFAAAWGITMVYVGFLLSAMGADFYPRLTEVIKDRDAAVGLMNDQAQLGLAIGGPILLLLIGWAPWVMMLLYTNAFMPAAELLQWQTVGNVFKLASWALSFAIVAAAQAKTYFFMELTFNAVFLYLSWVLLPKLGLIVTAIAFVAGYVVYFMTVWLLVRRKIEFRWQKLSLALLALHTLCAIGLLVIAYLSFLSAAVLAPVAALTTGVFGLRVVLSKIGTEGRLALQLHQLFTAIGWPVRVAQ